MPNKTANISNINCGHCTNTIEQELADLEGIVTVKASKEDKTVTIEWNEPPATWGKITELLVEIGYPVNNQLT
ncbi:MAG: cation transporter [Thiomargarita sp.]|nr:cation transporter [Thiomargarita sp.]